MRGSALGKVSTKAGPEVQPRAPLYGAPCTEQRSSRAETSSSWRAPQERAQPHWVAFRCGSSRNATQVPPLISWHSQLEAMGSIGQRAGNGSEARPSLTSKLRDALGQALRSKQQGQQKNSRPAQGGINPSAAQGPRQGAVQPKGLETYTVALGDVAAAGGVPPRRQRRQWRASLSRRPLCRRCCTTSGEGAGTPRGTRGRPPGGRMGQRTGDRARNRVEGGPFL